MEIRWEDPPPPRMTTKGEAAQRWAPFAEALRNEPKRWALVLAASAAECNNAAAYIRAGLGPFAPRGAFQATSRKDERAMTGRTYARYVGEGHDGAL
jgi:hypothetical protein